MTPKGAEDLAGTTTALDLVQRTRNLLKSLPQSNMPLGDLINTLKYKAGYDNDVSQIISALSLGGIVEAARILRPANIRALPALNMALQHTPNPAKDSRDLMLDKLNVIESQLQDQIKNTTKFERKNPGGGANAGAGTTPNTPLPSNPDRDAAKQRLMKLVTGQ